MSKNIIEFTKKLLAFYSKDYKDKLEMLYPEAYYENIEAFPLINLKNIDTYIIKGKKEALSFPYNIFLFQGTGVVKDLGDIADEEYAKLLNFNSEKEFILNSVNHKTDSKLPYYIDSYSLQAYINHDYKSPEEYIKIQKDNLSRQMLEKLKEDANKFINHIDKEASYYAKDAFRYVYSDLDFSPVIKAVNDEDFEYALNESIACYDQSLYLAAVSTAGTTLENLIVLILEKENKYDDNMNTQLGELSGRLRNLGLIDRRERKRIMLAAEFRNLASHANKGRVAREDAKLVYQAIFNLANKFYAI